MVDKPTTDKPYDKNQAEPKRHDHQPKQDDYDNDANKNRQDPNKKMPSHTK